MGHVDGHIRAYSEYLLEDCDDNSTAKDLEGLKKLFLEATNNFETVIEFNEDMYRRPLFYPRLHKRVEVSNIDYFYEIIDSQFCLVMRGDSPTTGHIYDALAAGCIPIVISDRWMEIGAPFSHIIDYTKFVVFINETEWKMNTAKSVENALLPILQNNMEKCKKILENLYKFRRWLIWTENSKLSQLVVHAMLREVEKVSLISPNK